MFDPIIVCLTQFRQCGGSLALYIRDSLPSSQPPFTADHPLGNQSEHAQVVLENPSACDRQCLVRIDIRFHHCNRYWCPAAALAKKTCRVGGLIPHITVHKLFFVNQTVRELRDMINVPAAPVTRGPV